MNKKIIATSLLAILTTLSLSTVNAEQKRKGPPGGGKPPVEAFEACSDKSEGDSCSFTGGRGDVSGMCKAPPHGEGELACAPEGGRPQK